MEAAINLYKKIIDKNLLIRRINITANKVINESEVRKSEYEQIDLFKNYQEESKRKNKEKKEKRLQETMINIKNKYGKNAILKGMNLEEGGTTIERNIQIGGHKG